MLQNLYKHIAQYTSVSEGEFEEVQSFFKQKRISKKENLIVSGDRCRYNFFVIEGCLQMFFIDDGGTNVGSSIMQSLDSQLDSKSYS